MADTDFSQFNPPAANIETDSTYQGDSTRTGGISLDQIMSSVLGNKILYQLSTMIRAICVWLVSKGYSPKDGTTPYTADTSTNVAVTALATVLGSAIPTNADLQNSGSPYAGLQVVTPAATDNSNKAVNSAFLQAYVTGGTPKQRIAQGQIGAGGTTVVTFATPFSSGTPVVVAIPIGNGTANLTATPTATGFSVNSSDGSPLNWIAIGNA
jgi:hypothetical protein